MLPGQVFDGQAGLHQNGARDYDSSLGRFVESDPIGLDGGMGLYSYADSSPLWIVDPDGQSPIKLIKLCVTGFKVIRNLSKREAIKLAREGEVDIKFLPKPNVLIDDQDIGTWKRFTVIHPLGVLDTVEAYLAMLEPGVTTSPPDRR